MEPKNVIFALMISVGFINVASASIQQGHCITSRCAAAADTLFQQPFDCLETPKKLVAAFDQCKIGCTRSVAEPLIQYGQQLNKLMIENGCTDERAAVTCAPSDILDCALRSVEIYPIVTKMSLDNLEGICTGLTTILDIAKSCTNCVQVLIPGFEAWSDTVVGVRDIVFTMANGACNCTRDIMKQIKYINAISQGGLSTCGIVKVAVDTAQTVAVECIGKMVNAPLKIDWLTMVNDYITTYLPYISNICTWVSSGSTLAPFGFLILTTGILLLVTKSILL